MKTITSLKLVVSSVALAIGITACGGGGGGSNGVDINGTQFDRMGIAGVNTVFIPSSRKDTFNSGDPSTDADFAAEIEATINGLRAAVGSVPGFPGEDVGLSAAQVRAIVNPDVVSLDLSAPDGFPNGRQLADDVIDVALQVTLNRSVVGDGVGNDSNYLPVFPYLGSAN